MTKIVLKCTPSDLQVAVLFEDLIAKIEHVVEVTSYGEAVVGEDKRLAELKSDIAMARAFADHFREA